MKNEYTLIQIFAMPTSTRFRPIGAENFETIEWFLENFGIEATPGPGVMFELETPETLQ